MTNNKKKGKMTSWKTKLDEWIDFYKCKELKHKPTHTQKLDDDWHSCNLAFFNKNNHQPRLLHLSIF